MYSRFTPGPDGTYQRRQIEEAAPRPEPPPLPPAPLRQHGLRRQLNDLLPGNLELGDILVLLIALLLLIDAEEDLQTILIAAAAFFFL